MDVTGDPFSCILRSEFFKLEFRESKPQSTNFGDASSIMSLDNGSITSFTNLDDDDHTPLLQSKPPLESRIKVKSIILRLAGYDHARDSDTVWPLYEWLMNRVDRNYLELFVFTLDERKTFPIGLYSRVIGEVSDLVGPNPEDQFRKPRVILDCPIGHNPEVDKRFVIYIASIPRNDVNCFLWERKLCKNIRTVTEKIFYEFGEAHEIETAGDVLRKYVCQFRRLRLLTSVVDLFPQEYDCYCDPMWENRRKHAQWRLQKALGDIRIPDCRLEVCVPALDKGNQCILHLGPKYYY